MFLGTECAPASMPASPALPHPAIATCHPSPAVHAALDPEYSILKQRIARRLKHEGATDESVKGLNLSESCCCGA